MPESFGASLRRTREEQQIALLTIAQQTKIKLSLLEGLERDDVSHWPSGIFRRAYIRAYAQAIGLDPDVVVREFLQAYPEASEVFETAMANALAADAARANSSSATRFRSLVDSALGSLSRLRRQASIDEVRVSDGSRSETNGVRSLPAFDAEPAIALPREIVSSTFAAFPAPVPAALDVADDTGIEVATVSDPKPEALDASAPQATAPMPLDEAPVEPGESAPPPRPATDWAAVAWLCTELGRVNTLDDLKILLEEAAGLLGANGLILWVWDEGTERLKAALAHGYSDKVLAHLPALRREADNATAAAFRSAQTCEIKATDDACGALAVPLLAPNGPSGVLALELESGREQSETLRAAATIVGALLCRLVDGPTAAEIERAEKARAAEAEARAAEAQARAAEMEAFKTAVRRVHARR